MRANFQVLVNCGLVSRKIISMQWNPISISEMIHFWGHSGSRWEQLFLRNIFISIWKESPDGGDKPGLTCVMSLLRILKMLTEKSNFEEIDGRVKMRSEREK